MQQGAPVVNPDAIRKALNCYPYITEHEKEVWHIAHTMVRALFLAGHEHVILDATNLTERRRSEWLSPEHTVEYACFDTPQTECERRARETEQDYLLPVIARMAQQIEWP